MTTDIQLLEQIKLKIKDNTDDISSFNYKDEKYWIKKGRETKSSSTHKFYYWLLKFDILVPVAYKTIEKSIEYETNKIKLFSSYGLSMPEVVYQDNKCFILSDCGNTVHSYIRQKDITEEILYDFVYKVLDQLVIIHNSEQFHGGAQSRNFLYKNGVVSIIDLEESFDENIDLKVLQFRDLILFILSLTKIKAPIDVDYDKIIKYYLNKSNNKDFAERLQKLANKLSFFLYLSDVKFIYSRLGSDIKNFFKLFKILRNLDI